MTTTEANGQDLGDMQGARTDRSGKGTGIFLDDIHRAQVNEWISWYYPVGTRVKLASVVQEMLDLAHSVGKADNQRAETPEARRGRLAGKGAS